MYILHLVNEVISSMRRQPLIWTTCSIVLGKVRLYLLKKVLFLVIIYIKKLRQARNQLA